MTFRVGQKVVCIKHSRGDAIMRGVPGSRPRIGEVCTVKTINHWSRGTLITVAEHDNSNLIGKYDRSGLEPGFNAACFRPLIERKTDISIFTKMLDDAKQPVTSRLEP